MQMFLYLYSCQVDAKKASMDLLANIPESETIPDRQQKIDSK